MAGFKLPTQDHPARAMLDIAHVAEVLNPANIAKLLTTQQARMAALRAMDADKAIRRINYIIIRQDSDERWLISIGRKGGWRKLWNFGTGR